MLVKKPVRRSQGRNQPLGSRARGPAPVESGTARLGSGSNRGAPPPAPVLSLEGNLPNPTLPTDLASGSRFRALENLDLNMAMEDQITEVAVDKDTASHPVSNEDTNSDLVGTDQAPIRIAEASQNGNSTIEVMESIPSGNPRDPSTAGHIDVAQDSLRPVIVATRMSLRVWIPLGPNGKPNPALMGCRPRTKARDLLGL